MNKQAVLEQIREEAFQDEIQKIAEENKGHPFFDYYGRTVMGANLGSLGGAAVGGGAGAGIGAIAGALNRAKGTKLIPKKGRAGRAAMIGAGIGAMGGSMAGALAGQTKGVQSFVKARTGKNISKDEALMQNMTHVGLRRTGYGLGGAVAGAGAGALAGLIGATKHPSKGYITATSAMVGGALGAGAGALAGTVQGAKALERYNK